VSQRVGAKRRPMTGSANAIRDPYAATVFAWRDV
jgi:hypothetical protein